MGRHARQGHENDADELSPLQSSVFLVLGPTPGSFICGEGRLPSSCGPWAEDFALKGEELIHKFLLVSELGYFK